MMRRKCRPQQWPDQGRCLCECLRKIDPQRLFRENTRDVANALVEVMLICGIHECKAKAAKEVILNAFTHYDEVRHRIDAIPKKSLRKEYLMHILGCKCLMTRIEAQLTYTIMKRAFKAFYYGTDEFGIRNPIIEAQLVHSQECLWVHAAKRTAQIYAEYEGMFFPVQKRFEERIRCVYWRLYERMLKRASPIKLAACCCKNCVKRTIPTSADNTDKMNKIDKTEVISTGKDELSLNMNDSNISTACEHNKLREKAAQKSKEEEQLKSNDLKRIESKQNLEKLPRCIGCKCPKLICECKIDNKTGLLNYECSQGPFKVRWIRMDEEKENDPCITKPESHVCPIDCDDLSSLSSENDDSGGECGVCECEDEVTDDILSEVETRMAEADDEKSTELSDTRTVYSCHMPNPDLVPVMLQDKSMCDKETIKSIKEANRRTIQKVKSTDTSRLSGGSKTSEQKRATIRTTRTSQGSIHNNDNETEALLNKLGSKLLGLAKKSSLNMDFDGDIFTNDTKVMEASTINKSKHISTKTQANDSDKGYHSDPSAVSNTNKFTASIKKIDKDGGYHSEVLSDNVLKTCTSTPNGPRDNGYHSDINSITSKSNTGKALKSTNVSHKQSSFVNAVNRSNQTKSSSLKISKPKTLKGTWTTISKKKKVSFLEKSAGDRCVGENKMANSKPPFPCK